MISIAVLGYGTVGSGVVEVIEKNKDVIDRRAGEEIRVSGISPETRMRTGWCMM